MFWCFSAVLFEMKLCCVLLKGHGLTTCLKITSSQLIYDETKQGIGNDDDGLEAFRSK